jgi:hypothetical protein
MTKPSIAALLLASGHSAFPTSYILQASRTLYGDVGVNLDERDWAVIMAAGDPLATAQQALKDQWQNADYLLRNADYLASLGYSPVAIESTYRQMADRLGFTYDASWSFGTGYESPVIGFEFTDTTANLDVSLAGTLSFSVAGSSISINAGDVALTPGATLKEGFVTVTRDSGAATTTDTYVVVGTNTAMSRDLDSGRPIADRLVILGRANDNVSAGDSNDTVYGGDGADTISGNQGDDLIRGGAGADSIHAGSGNDTVYGEAGDDMIYGGSDGNDQLSGGADADNFLIPDDGTGIDTVTDFVSGVDDISVTSSTIAIARRPLSAIGTETATTSAGATNSIEIADNDVHYVSVNGQAGALTIDGTAILTSADLTASTLTNLAAYLDERFNNAVATGASGDVDAIMVVNWTAPSSTTSYVYEFTENAASVNISASELALLGVIERSSAILTIGDVI